MSTFPRNPSVGDTVTHVAPGDAVVNAVAMDSAGRMVVAAYSTPSSGSNIQFSLVRYHGHDFAASIGYKDLRFNSNGIASANGYPVLIGANHSVVVAGDCANPVMPQNHYRGGGICQRRRGERGGGGRIKSSDYRRLRVADRRDFIKHDTGSIHPRRFVRYEFRQRRCRQHAAQRVYRCARHRYHARCQRPCAVVDATGIFPERDSVCPPRIRQLRWRRDGISRKAEILPQQVDLVGETTAIQPSTFAEDQRVFGSFYITVQPCMAALISELRSASSEVSGGSGVACSSAHVGFRRAR